MVVEKGGDFLFQLKGDNQPIALAEAERIAAAGTPPFACETNDRGHGRIEPSASGLPHVRSLIKTTISSHVSSLVPQRAQRFGTLIRGHWGGCEIRNHWVRDALWGEDTTLSKNKNLNGNLAVLRCALTALKGRHAKDRSWTTIFELSAMRPELPFHLICNNALK